MDELPLFPAPAPAVFSDAAATKALFAPVLARLADIVEVPDAALAGQTPCDGFDVSELRRHTLAWLQFMAAALNDPAGATDRLDPETWQLGPGEEPGDIVRGVAADLNAAIDAGAAAEVVAMSEARMPGAAVLGMMLGEYIVHGWDIATATGRTWDADAAAASPAREFLEGIVAPEHRGPESGFFGVEQVAPDGATEFERLLCFAGRDPQWRP